MPKWIMVLNDGTTFTNLDGCAIVAIPEDMPDDEIEHFAKHSDGWYCFDDKPPTELKTNNGFTEGQLEKQDLEYWQENWRRLDDFGREL